MNMERLWNKYGKTSQVPELMFSSEWSVERVVWTYERDVGVFGLVLDLKSLVREHEFKNLSPIMPRCLAG